MNNFEQMVSVQESYPNIFTFDAINIIDIENKAHQGDSNAQNTLGELYIENIETLKAEYKLTGNFEKTLDKEVFYCINTLFLRYGEIFIFEKVTDIIKDNKKAFKWFQKSAQQNNDEGQYNLASSYYNGLGIKQDFKQALKWFKESAKQNNKQAQYALATMYLDGKETKKDFIKAIKWFTKAGKNKHALAIIFLYAIYKYGICIDTDKHKAYKLLQILEHK